MEAFKQFVLEHWQALLAILIALATLLVAIFKGKKEGKSVKEILIDFITDRLPSYIRETEAHGGTAEQKKSYCLNLALRDAAKEIGHQLTVEEADYIVNKVSEKIEDILSTPQKKEQSNPIGGTKHVSRYRQ